MAAEKYIFFVLLCRVVEKKNERSGEIGERERERRKVEEDFLTFATRSTISATICRIASIDLSFNVGIKLFTNRRAEVPPIEV